MTAEGNFEGHNILNRLKHLPRSIDGRDAARRAASKAARRAREPGAARPRRQGAGRLERADDRGARQCRHHASTSPTGSTWRQRAFLFIAARDGQRRPPRPFLARGRALASGARLRLRRHDPRRAGAVRGDRRARLSRTRAGLAGHASIATTPTQTTAATSSPPTTPRAWWCGRARPPTTRRPTPMPSPRRTWSGSPRSPARHAWRDQADRLFDGVAAERRRKPVRPSGLLNALDLRLRAAEIVVTGRRGAANALPRRALKLPYPRSHRPARADRRRRCRPRIRRRRRSPRRRTRAAFVCVGETCSLPVTDPDAIATPLRRDARIRRSASLAERFQSSERRASAALRRRGTSRFMNRYGATWTSRVGELACVASSVRSSHFTCCCRTCAFAEDEKLTIGSSTASTARTIADA